MRERKINKDNTDSLQISQVLSRIYSFIFNTYTDSICLKFLKHQMSNVQLLIGDPNGLLTDSKRRFPDIRLSCEAAIKVLKVIH